MKRLLRRIKSYFFPKKKWESIDWDKEYLGDGYGY